MAVTDVSEVKVNRRASRTGRSSASITRTFKVETNSATTTEWEVVNAAGLPSMYAAHPGSNYLRAYQFDARPLSSGTDAPTFWHVDVTYVAITELLSNSGGAGGAGAYSDPWDLPWRVSIGNGGSYAQGESLCYGVTRTQLPNHPASISVVGTQGSPGAPIINSSGDVYKLQANYFHATLIRLFKSYQASSWDISSIDDYKDTLNSTAITITGLTCSALTLWMRDITAESRITADGEDYWEVSYEIEYNKRRHLDARMDLSKDGETKLDGSGSPLLSGEPYYNHFLLKFPRNWTALSLPQYVVPPAPSTGSA